MIKTLSISTAVFILFIFGLTFIIINLAKVADQNVLFETMSDISIKFILLALFGLLGSISAYITISRRLILSTMTPLLGYENDKKPDYYNADDEEFEKRLKIDNEKNNKVKKRIIYSALGLLFFIAELLVLVVIINIILNI